MVERDHNRRMEDIKRRSTVSRTTCAAAARQVQKADKEQSDDLADSAVHNIADEEEELATRTSTLSMTTVSLKLHSHMMARLKDQGYHL